MVGRTIHHYEILEKVGEGGMGVVFKARDTRLNRLVALKVLLEHRTVSDEGRRRFEQEARAASGLSHPNIVTIYDITEIDGASCIVMEYIDGRSLSEVIRGGLKTPEALEYAIQVADALSRAHAAGIVHRDLKPANIMIAAGRAKVLDFGLAKLTERTGAGALDVTETLQGATAEGTILGTFAYMSPEQAEGKKVDSRSDIFSFGVVLYEMIAGRRAFEGTSPISTLSAILRTDPRPVSELAAGVHPELEKIIARCLRKDPERRTQVLLDVKLALEELKDEIGRAPSVRETPARKRPVRIWFPLLLAILAIAGAALSVRPAGADLPPTVSLLLLLKVVKRAHPHGRRMASQSRMCCRPARSAKSLSAAWTLLLLRKLPGLLSIVRRRSGHRTADASISGRKAACGRWVLRAERHASR